MDANITAVLLDIEGTTSSISYVHYTMFPYAKENLEAFVDQNWGSEALKGIIQLLEIDYESFGNPDSSVEQKGRAGQWLSTFPDDSSKKNAIQEFVLKMMDHDIKATGLKKLQGAIWKSGFESGKLVSHLWPEVHPVLMKWKQGGLDLRIYSSGSVQAQKLFFGHTEKGDLLNLFSGHYDTEIGSKKEKESYLKIISDWKRPAGQILFISDSIDELDAAAGAGLNVALSIRPGNQEITRDHSYQSLTGFDELDLT